MPNRILRDITDSEKVNSLSAQAEVLFYRLMMKADDYGVFHAKPSLIKANCYPLRLDSVREAEISRWLTECEKAGLIAFYNAESKPFLVIINFGQRMRNMKKRFPSPPDILLQSAASCRELPPERETETRNEKQKRESEKHPHTHLILEPTEIERRMLDDEYHVKEFIARTYQFSDSDYTRAVKMFIGEKTSGENELDKDYADVLRHFKSWVKHNHLKLSKMFNQATNMQNSKGAASIISINQLAKDGVSEN